MPTNMASPSVAAAARRPPSSSKVGRLASSDTIETGGFTPGQVLIERYRVIGLLGRGGMGEVYRADDLKLGQPVALKFLPRPFARDADRIERFYAEVRNARQVSHPNVCRVYDVGEIDGQQYLSMEYVDGEDLASLLRRIGRLPPDKALEISRELCAGLAAAHDKGVLHRDLKPANVMIDGRGRARITDFGLAVAAGDVPEGEVSGTPAYMAPEQLAGGKASVRSDVYALGLVLYELSTGRKAFDGASFEELRRKHGEDPPTAPSAVAPGFDPVVERVILRCLEKDPAARPASVSQVAAALPGGDPLAAALAAGETPSPEMVAAAGERGVISPAAARRLLFALAAALVLSIVLTPRANIAAFVGTLKSPEVLRERAQGILESVGLGKPADHANWFQTTAGFLVWARGHGGYRGDLARDAVAFDYRQAPAPLVPGLTLTGPYPSPFVDGLNPPPVDPGMAEVWLDPRGRLVRLAVVPPEFQSGAATTPETDWGLLFREAGLDMKLFVPVEPRWSPPSFATARAAWEGPHPEHPGVSMRVEAASYRGRPVYFRWIGPWTRPAEDPAGRGAGTGELVFEGLLVFLLLASAALARHNLRAGRGDRRGATRFGAAVFLFQFGSWALGGHHVASSDEGWILITAFCNAAGMGIAVWMLYLALEPFARRNWPQMLISWTRALSGSWRDPLVGRDVLIGTVAGTAAGLILGPLRVLIPLWLGIPGPPPHAVDVLTPLNFGGAVAQILGIAINSAVWILGIVFLLILARLVVRRGWLGGLIVTLLYVGIYLGGPSPEVTLPLAAISVGIVVALTVRFGVLAAIAAETCRRVLGYNIYSSDPSSWNFFPGLIAVVAVVALAYWATTVACAPLRDLRARP